MYCGYCVEACPCDAIRMDSGIYTIFATKREDFVINKEQLLQIEPQDPSEARPKQGMPPLNSERAHPQQYIPSQSPPVQ